MTDKAQELLDSIRQDLSVGRRILKQGSGFSAMETRLTVLAHSCSDLLALCADQSVNRNIEMYQCFALMGEIGALASEFHAFRRAHVVLGAAGP